MIAPALLQGVLGVLALYHLAIGVLAVVSLPATARVVAGLYGVNVATHSQLRYAVRMLGLYAIALGALLTFAAFDPAAHRAIIGVVAGLQLARAASRALFQAELMDAFRVSGRRNAIAIILLVLEAAALFAGLALLPTG